MAESVPLPESMKKRVGTAGVVAAVGLVFTLLVALALGAEQGPGPAGVVLIFVGLAAVALLGAPLFLVLGAVATLCFLLFGDAYYRDFRAYEVFVVKIANLSTKNVLLAVPFFVVSGAIMSAGTIATRLIALARALTCWMPGGLGVATVFACMFFAAISGSSPVTVIAIGGVMYPALLKARYGERFSLGLLTAAGSLGIIIPPSIPMLVYALIASNTAPVDVSEMFLAGVVPGFVLGGVLCLYAVYVGIRLKTPVSKFDFKEVSRTFREGVWALGLPIVILGGIYSGLFTPTEAAAVSVAYALAVELFVHRQLKWRDLSKTLLESGISLGALLMIMALSFGLNDFLVEQQVPERAGAWIIGKELSPLEFLLALNVLLLLAGCLMDSISALLILGPMLVPIGYALGIDLVHLGVIFIVNLEIGYITPPVGMNLFVASSIFKKSLGTVMRGALPFVGLLAAGLVVMTLLPTLSLGLVNVALRDTDFYSSFPTREAAIARNAPKPVTPEMVEEDKPPEGVKTLQQMMEEAKRRTEGEGEGTDDTADAPDKPGRVKTLQEMMQEAKQRKETAEPAE